MFREMPKAELHLHLDGAIPPRTVLEIAARNKLLDLLPGDSEDSIARWFVFQDFAHFASVARVIKNLLRTPEDFALATYAMGRELAAQNVRYAEITFTPYTYTHVLNPGATIETILEGLEVGRKQVRDELGVELRWVFDIPRNRAFTDYQHGGDYVVGAAERTLEHALRGMEYGVVGLGLGGNEVNAPPRPFAPVFAEAKAGGLKSLPHAGESTGPHSIWGAIDALQADRVGHGVRAIEDEALVRELVARQIPLELNMTCNVYLKFYPHIQGHPFPLLDQAGVPVTVNSDDPALISTTLSQEYQLLVDVFGYNRAAVTRIARRAFEVSCAEPALKANLLAEFDAWAAQEGSV